MKSKTDQVNRKFGESKDTVEGIGKKVNEQHNPAKRSDQRKNDTPDWRTEDSSNRRIEDTQGYKKEHLSDQRKDDSPYRRTENTQGYKKEHLSDQHKDSSDRRTEDAYGHKKEY